MVLGSQDALPVATAFTEYVHAYFRGHSPRCAKLGEDRAGLPAPWLGLAREEADLTQPWKASATELTAGPCPLGGGSPRAVQQG